MVLAFLALNHVFHCRNEGEAGGPGPCVHGLLLEISPFRSACRRFPTGALLPLSSAKSLHPAKPSVKFV